MGVCRGLLKGVTVGVTKVSGRFVAAGTLLLFLTCFCTGFVRSTDCPRDGLKPQRPNL